MNHLRELLDRLGTGDYRVDPSIAADALPQLEIQIQHQAAMAQCFWMGDMDGICELQVVPELARLPYKTAWFEGEGPMPDGAPPLIGLLACERDDGLVDCVCFMRRTHQWALMWAAGDLDMQRGSFALSSQLPDVATGAHYCIYALRAFCCAINCTNVGRQEHQPERKLQKARSKRGKAPLFSYWTLMLNGRGGETHDLGGTHASPRVHLRRGHPRQYAPGKWTWVQAHAVGNRAAGMVHKDYSAGPHLHSCAGR